MYTTSLGLVCHLRAKEAIVGYPPLFSLFSVAFRLAGLTMLAGCKFSLRQSKYPFDANSSDNVNGRIFTTTLPGNPNNTVEICIATCAQQNFTVAGTEFAGT